MSVRWRSPIHLPVAPLATQGPSTLRQKTGTGALFDGAWMIEHLAHQKALCLSPKCGEVAFQLATAVAPLPFWQG